MLENSQKMADIGDLSFYDRNFKWMQSRNQRKDCQFEEKISLEMKDCTFKPKIQIENQKNQKNLLNKTASSKKSLEKSSNLLSNNDSYVEIYNKKKRGHSLSGQSLPKKSMK